MAFSIKNEYFNHFKSDAMSPFCFCFLRAWLCFLIQVLLFVCLFVVMLGLHPESHPALSSS